jgi:hypothetical protein
VQLGRNPTPFVLRELAKVIGRVRALGRPFGLRLRVESSLAGISAQKFQVQRCRRRAAAHDMASSLGSLFGFTQWRHVIKHCAPVASGNPAILGGFPRFLFFCGNLQSAK